MRASKNRIPKYSDCPKCRLNDTYLFVRNESYEYWICNNCNNQFKIEKNDTNNNGTNIQSDVSNRETRSNGETL